MEASFLWKLASLKERILSKNIDGDVFETVVRCLTRIPHMLKDSRPIGATVIIGDPRDLFSYLQISHPIRVTENLDFDSEITRELADILDPSSYAIIVDPRKGMIKGVRELLSRETGAAAGIDLIPELTGALECTALMVRRAERNLRIYVDGIVCADIVLSEQRGC